jgi:hypothetical protein
MNLNQSYETLNLSLEALEMNLIKVDLKLR